MIETVLQQIIADLGATGVLIIGIFWIQHQATKKTCEALKVLNHKTTEINQTLKEIGAFLEREAHGKMGRHPERTG